MANTPLKPRGSTADFLADKVLRSLIFTLMQLPYDQRIATMGRLVEHGIGPLVGYRKRAMSQLGSIFPDMGFEQRRKLAAKVCNNFGRTLIENYSWPELHDRVKNTVPTGTGMSHISDARDAGRPILFVTGHYGNHEVPRHVLTELGYDIGGLYRPMGNPYFNDHYAKTMTSWGGPVFAQGKRGTMGFTRHLKKGGMGTLLFDVATSTGIPLNFLGKQALTATSAADIAVRIDALVVPYFARRCDDGLSFEVSVEAPIAHANPAEMMQNMTDVLATQIRQDPAQWFWVHRRWKSY